MAWVQSLQERLRALFQRGRVEAELDEELRFHLEKEIEKNLGTGMPPREARRQAHFRFGGVEWVKEQVREERGVRPAEIILTDVRYAARTLRKNPGFSLVVILVLALGIGANSAAFSFVNAFFLKESPVHEPDRLVRIFPQWEGGIQYGNLSVPEYLDLRQRNSAFTEVVTESPIPLHLSVQGRNERVWGSIVSGNYFSGLGIELALGRGFLPEEDRTPDTHPVVVLGHGLWRRYFGSDPAALGRTILLNNTPFTVVGIARQGFHGTNVGLESELWAPLMMRHRLVPGKSYIDARGGRWLMFTMGRMKAGVTLEQAEADCNSVLGRLAQEYPTLYGEERYRLFPEKEASLYPEARGHLKAGLGAFWALVGIVLLLACANVAGLLLSRSAARQREIGIRLALGAGRTRVAHHLFAESALLALVAGVLGLAVSDLLLSLMQSFQVPTNLPIHFRASVDRWVLLFTLLLSIVTGIVCGVAPSLQMAGQELLPALRDGTLGGERRSGTLRRVLVVGQLALSTVLLAATGLVVRSLRNAGEIDLGFEPRSQLVASVDLDLQGYGQREGRLFIADLTDRIRSLPRVQAVGISKTLPLTMDTDRTGFRPERFEPPPDFRYPAVEYNVIDSGYLTAMGIPLQRGRGFSQREDGEATRVVIVNEALAQLYWGQESPVGERVWIGMGGEGFEVIGVVANAKYHSLGERPAPGMYLPLGRFYTGEVNLHIRGMGEVRSLAESVRSEILALDGMLPLHKLETMTSHLGFAMLPARMTAGTVTAFAFLALLLAALGLYGVLAYSVRRDTRHLGIRIALGATPGRILGLILRRGMILTGVGLGVGLALAAVVTRLTAGLLYGVTPTDPLSFVGALAFLTAVGLVAALHPALRATRVDPVRAINVE